MPDLDAVFSALADPTRRSVLEALTGAPATATELGDQFTVSRQAIVKHLACLERTGLVEAERDGRSVYYRMTPAAFSDAVEWMASIGSPWDRRLARLAELATRARRS